jgi:hypothetical protein
MSDDAKQDTRPGRLLLGAIFWAVAFYIFLAPHGPGHWERPRPAWHLFSPLIGAVVGLAIEVIGRPEKNFRRTTRYIVCGAVLGITLEWIASNRISEARAIRGWKGEIDESVVLIDRNEEVLDDFLRRLIFLPIAALLGGVAGFRIRRYQPTYDKPDEPRSSRMVAFLFGILSGVLCGVVGSVLGGYVGPHIEAQAFAKKLAESQTRADILPLMTFAGMFFGGCFGWLFGWLLTAFLSRKRMRTRGDYILIWVLGLLPISALIALILIAPNFFRTTPWPP